MQTVISFFTTGLNNGVHFLYNSETAKRAEATQVIMRKMSAQVNALKEAVRREDEAFKLSTKSLYTDRIRAADRVRVTLFSSIHKVVNSYLKVPSAEAPALELSEVIKSYAIKLKGQLDTKSSEFDNLVRDFLTVYASQVKALGLTDLVGNLDKANQEVMSLMAARDEEKKTHLNGALAAARKATDAAYHEFIETLNAHVRLEGDTVYLDFINYLNSVIRRYQRQLLHQKGKYPSAGDVGAGDGGSGNGNGDDEDVPQG
ncbi:MAG: DUF6261 family protein [Prevotellaceae bacterium]|jgi:hypothetical protein|nr:DUF6261 family protein [Prevotellaceae bacterium]